MSNPPQHNPAQFPFSRSPVLPSSRTPRSPVLPSSRPPVLPSLLSNLERTRHNGDVRDTKVCLRALGETAHALSAATHETEIISTLLEQVVRVFAARAAVARLLSPDGQELLLAGAHGLSDAYLHKGPVRVSESRIDRQVLSGEVVVISDVTREPGFQYSSEAGGEGLKGMAVVPLKVRDSVIGVLRVYVDDVDEFTQDDLILADILTDLGAVALEKIRLHEALYRIAEALNASLEMEPMLQRVLEATVERMRLKAASIRLLNPKDELLHLVASYGLSDAYLSKGSVHFGRSKVDQKVLRGESVVIFDVAEESDFEYPEEAAHEGIRSLLVVPIRLKDRVLGSMRVYSARSRHFSVVDIGFLTSVSGLVAMAIENSELYSALRTRYEDLQVDLADWYRFLALG
jgi:GAF domain-containing protein